MQKRCEIKKIVLASCTLLVGGRYACAMEKRSGSVGESPKALARSKARWNLLEGLSSKTLEDLRKIQPESIASVPSIPRSLPIPIPVGGPLTKKKERS